MAEAQKQTRVRNFERNYSDETGKVEVAHNDDTVAAFDVASINADVLRRAAMRYVTDILVGIGNQALKAEGGTPEKAQEKMEATLAAMQNGEFTFRSASGAAGLSAEEEQGIIAAAIVAMGKAPTEGDALAKVVEIYNRTTENKKGFTVRKDYNQLKAVPQIKLALTQASKKESNLDALLG